MSVIYAKKGTSSTAAGTFSVTIPAVSGICKQVLVKPATATTTFDVKLVDIYSLDVLEETNATGFYNQMLELPCYGSWTFTISNASVDEVFTYLVVVQEY